MGQGFPHRLEHVLEGADPGEDHGNIQNHREQPPQGDVLQNPGQGDKEQGGPRPDVQPVGKTGGDHHQGGHQGGDGIEEGRPFRQLRHVLRRVQVGPVDDHAASGDGQGEESLSHGPDPHHGVQQLLPPGGEHIAVALRRAGEEGHPHRQDEEDQEKEGHHDLVALFDALGPQQKRQQRAHHHDGVEGNHGVVRQGKALKPGGGVRRHQLPGEGAGESLQHVGDDNRVADGDAHGPRQGQPAQKAPGPAQLLLPGAPGHFIGPQGPRPGPAAHGVLRRQAHGAEEGDEDQVGDEEGPAAVAAHLGGKAPHVGHAHRRAHRREDKAPLAAELALLVLVAHAVPPSRSS